MKADQARPVEVAPGFMRRAAGKIPKFLLECRCHWRDVMADVAPGATRSLEKLEQTKADQIFPALCVMLDKLLEPYLYDPWD